MPTTYIDKNRGNPLIYLSSLSTIFPSAESILYTNQYALTEYKQTGAKTPGIFMKYEIEAISVSVIEEMQTTFSHFLVRLCGIAGEAREQTNKKK